MGDEEITADPTPVDTPESDCSWCGQAGKVAGIMCLVLGGIFLLIGIDFLRSARNDNGD